jgi:DnaJ family protein C protein 19
MSKREAALILSVPPSASKKEIKDAHRRLMMLNHPDSGI